MLLFIIEFLVFMLTFVLIHTIYNKNYNSNISVDNYFNHQLLHMDYTMNRMLPSDYGFWSLKFSILRHFTITLISSILIFNFNNYLLWSIMFWINAIYLLPKFYVQLQRKKHINNSSDTKDALTPALNACTVMTVYCCIAFILFVVACIIF